MAYPGEIFEDNIKSVWVRFRQKKDEKTRRKLLEYYFPFVKKIAYKMAESLNWHVQHDELSSLGIDGLYKAIDSYDPEVGVKFESYSTPRIKGSMIDGLRRQDLIPRSVRLTSEKFNRHKERLENHYQHRLSDAEFARISGLDESFHMNGSKYIPLNFSHLDSGSNPGAEEAIKQDCNFALWDHGAPDPSARVFRKEFFSKLMGLNFTKQERKIIYLYYYQGLTMDRVAKNISLSESRVSQMHKDILGRLKDRAKRNPEYFQEIQEFVKACKSPDALF